MDQARSNIIAYSLKMIDQDMQVHPTRLINRGLRLLARIVATLIRSAKGISFPERKIGGIWDISRYQIEFCMGWLEPESVFQVKKLVRPGMTVLDIGAHVGYYSDLFSRLVKTEGSVHAIEASPENFPILKKNLVARRRTNVTAHHAAVSDQNGTIELYISPGHSNHSVVAGYTDSQKSVTVKSIRLDDFFPNQQFDFIKMDVEGYEPHVLSGMRDLIQRANSLNMLIEYNPIALSKAYSSPRVLLDLLVELGLEYKAILEDGTLGDVLSDTETVNLLCSKKKERSAQ